MITINHLDSVRFSEHRATNFSKLTNSDVPWKRRQAHTLCEWIILSGALATLMLGTLNVQILVGCEDFKNFVQARALSHGESNTSVTPAKA